MYLLDTFLADSSKHHTVLSIVMKWADVMDEYHVDGKAIPSVLVFDNYYASKDSISALSENHINFIAGLRPDRFKSTIQQFGALGCDITKKNPTTAIENTKLNQVFVHQMAKMATVTNL